MMLHLKRERFCGCDTDCACPVEDYEWDESYRAANPPSYTDCQLEHFGKLKMEELRRRVNA